MRQAVILLIITFITSETLFRRLNLYYEFWWLDIPMHIWGGFLLAMLVTSFYLQKSKMISFEKLLILILIATLCWEIVHHVYRYFTILEQGSIYNSLKDIFNGLIGAIAYRYLVKSQVSK